MSSQSFEFKKDSTFYSCLSRIIERYEQLSHKKVDESILIYESTEHEVYQLIFKTFSSAHDYGYEDVAVSVSLIADKYYISTLNSSSCYLFSDIFKNYRNGVRA